MNDQQKTEIDGVTPRSILSWALVGERPYDQAQAILDKIATKGWTVARIDADTIAETVREVMEDHIWRPRKKGPVKCWSANDRECGRRFTTGGEYRAHVAALVAERLTTPPASTLPACPSCGNTDHYCGACGGQMND